MVSHSPMNFAALLYVSVPGHAYARRRSTRLNIILPFEHGSPASFDQWIGLQSLPVEVLIQPLIAAPMLALNCPGILAAVDCEYKFPFSHVIAYDGSNVIDARALAGVAIGACGVAQAGDYTAPHMNWRANPVYGVGGAG